MQEHQNNRIKPRYEVSLVPQILILVLMQHGKQDPQYFLPLKEILEGHHKEMLTAFVKEYNHNKQRFLIKWRKL